MKNAIFAIFLAFAVTGCGTLKKNSKTTTEATKTETTTKSVETTTITEKATTTVTTQADTVNVSKPLDSVIGGDTIKKETEYTEIKTYYDKHTKEIKTDVITKPQSIPVNIDRTIVSKKETETNTKQDSKSETKSKDKERKSNISEFKWTFLWLFLILVVVYFIYRRFKN